jgi:uncharacterized membrane protein YbhN (UPF0104 family)
MSDPSPMPARGPWRRALIWTGRLTALLVAGWIAWRALRELEWSELFALVGSASPVWLAVALLLLAARPAVGALRWRLALERIGSTPGRVWTFFAVAGSLLVDHLTPTARLLSSVVRSRWLDRASSQPVGRIFGTVLFEQLTHEVVMAIATVAGLAVVPALLGRWSLAAGVALLGAVFVLGTLEWARRRGGGPADGIARFLHRRAEGGRGRLQRLFLHGGEAVSVGRDLVRDTGLGARCVALSVGFLALNVLAQWAAFRSIGAEPGLLPIFAVVSLGLTAGVIAGTPGGAGATEAVMVSVYVLLGVERTDAAAGALLFRGLHYLTVLALGLPALAVFELVPARTETSRAQPPVSKPNRSKTSDSSATTRSRVRPSSSSE